MAILYDPHLKERLKERKIPEEWPREIIEEAREQYHDQATGLYVAIDKRWYKEEEREMAVSYVTQGSDQKAITIHPIGHNQKQNRIDAGRWVKV